MILYNVIIKIYGALIWVVQPFSAKARKWMSGRSNIWNEISSGTKEDCETIWIHCSSLGEFEQGRPVIESLRQKNPQSHLILTFFSPSGYEIRKNYSLVDQVLYLPLDTRENAQSFINKIKPDLAIFVKYDFWFNYLSELNRQKTPFIYISAVFRKNHFLFNWWAKPLLKIFSAANQIFVQDQLSLSLMRENHCPAILSGDTRVDRVIALQDNRKKYDALEKTIEGRNTLIFGSVWPEDLLIARSWITEVLTHSNDFLVLAPHDISTKMYDRFVDIIGTTPMRFSKMKSAASGTQIVLIDTIGDLAHLYAIANLAYVGGGFGKGIHSILEPAAAGLPVIFGPRYHKFKEAQDLIDLKAARSIQTEMEFREAVTHFSLPQNKEIASAGIRQFLKTHQGATSKIVHYLVKAKLIS